jgi:hypothetical protein
MVMQETVRWNYTSVLNVGFLAVSAALLVRFLKTGGPAMLREMGNVPAGPNAEPHSCCHEEGVAVAAVRDCCDEQPVAMAVMEHCCQPKVEVVAEIKHDCCHVEPEPVAKHDCH